MRVLVTGGAGFIGSHLCERLLARGAHVICLDNFFTGRRENIEHLLHFQDFELLRHDVTEPIFIDVDQIYNLACPASPIHYQYNPVKTVKSNVMGAINMLVLAKRVGARVLQASTSEVYGDPTVHPQPESYWGNVNPIDKAKWQEPAANQCAGVGRNRTHGRRRLSNGSGGNPLGLHLPVAADRMREHCRLDGVWDGRLRRFWPAARGAVRRSLSCT
jgi:hypothetical protein